MQKQILQVMLMHIYILYIYKIDRQIGRYIYIYIYKIDRQAGIYIYIYIYIYTAIED